MYHAYLNVMQDSGKVFNTFEQQQYLKKCIINTYNMVNICVKT